MILLIIIIIITLPNSPDLLHAVVLCGTGWGYGEQVQGKGKKILKA